MTRPRPAHVVLALCALAALAFAVQPSSQAPWLLLFDVVAVTTLVVFALAVPRIERHGRRAWLLLMVGQALSVVGDITYDIANLRSEGLPWIGDLAYALSAVARLAALVIVVRKRSPGRDGLVWIDGILIGTTALALIAAFVLIPLYESQPDALGRWFLTMGYLAVDAMIVAVMVRLVLSSVVIPNAPLWLVLGAQVVFMASDVAYALTVTPATGESGLPGIVQTGWLASYVLLAYTATRPDAARLADPGPYAVPRFHPVGFIAVAAATLLVPVGLLALLGEDDDRVNAVLAASNVVIVVLLLLRSWLLLRISQSQADHLGELARTDPLTGLPNRRRWEHLLRQRVMAAEDADAPLVVAMGDLDGFKPYNDHNGHPAGDELLRRCAGAWEEELPPGAVLARLGGDEFGILLPGHTPESARPFLLRVQAATPDEVTLSLGMTQRHRGISAERIQSDADVALYAAKRGGRNRIEVFDRATDGRSASAAPIGDDDARPAE